MCIREPGLKLETIAEYSISADMSPHELMNRLDVVADVAMYEIIDE